LTLQLYILRQLVLAIGFALAGIALFVLPTSLIQAIHKLDGVSLLVVLEYLPMVLVELVPYLLPMAFLLGVVATYGRLAAERELVAIRMAGIHPALLALPALGVAGVLGLWTGHLLSDVSPDWKYQSRNFQRHQAVKAFKNFGQGRTELAFGDSTLTAQRASGNRFQGVLLDLAQEDGEVLTLTADIAVLDILESSDPETGEPEEVLRIECQNPRLLGEGMTLRGESWSWSAPLRELFPVQEKDRFKAKYLNSDVLREELDAGRLDEEDAREFLFEIHRRRALSWIYLVFLLLGIPTGIALRSSTQLGAFTGAVGYGFLYYVLAIQVGKALVGAGEVPPIAAAWTTNGIFLLVGAVFFFRTLWR